MFWQKKWGILIKKESESLIFTGLEIPRDYKKKRGDPTEIGHSREGASTKAYVIINQKSEGKTKMGKLYFRYGAMGSSKTANLLMVHYNFLERGRVRLF